MYDCQPLVLSTLSTVIPANAGEVVHGCTVYAPKDGGVVHGRSVYEPKDGIHGMWHGSIKTKKWCMDAPFTNLRTESRENGREVIWNDNRVYIYYPANEMGPYIQE